jgi:hypothetical protein
MTIQLENTHITMNKQGKMHLDGKSQKSGYLWEEAGSDQERGQYYIGVFTF